MKRHAALTSTFTNVLDSSGTLSARAHQGLRASRLRGVARSVAFVIGITLSIPMQVVDAGQKMPFSSSKELIKYVANKQLSDIQYKCHNEIIYRESRWNDKAIGNIGGVKQAYGLYQLKIASMRTAHVERQFWKYWEYVSYRYGVTALDEPNYCVALAHLKNKGWQ
jgi:hypothetical protein